MEENKQYTKPEYQPVKASDEQEIDWMGIIRQLIAIRKTLYKAAGVGLIIGIIIAFSIPKQYTVSVTLSPEVSSGKSSGSGLASMAASFLGTSIGADSPDALNATLAPDIIASTPFLLELLKSRIVSYDGKIDTTLSAYLEMQSMPWWNYILKVPNIAINSIKSILNKNEEATTKDSTNKGFISLTKEENDKLKILRQQLTAEIDKKTNITIFTTTLQDPKIAAAIADSVVTKLQQYIIAYRTSKAKEDCKYLELLYKERQQEYYKAQQKYAHYVDANSNMVFQSTMAERERLQNDMNLAYQVYSQVAQQLQVARAKVQEEKPVFAIVEPAIVPLQPSGTSRKTILFAVIILTVGGVCVWELIGEKYWKFFKLLFKK